MRGRTWQPPRPKPQLPPRVKADVRADVDTQIAPIITRLKRRICRKPKQSTFNWPDDLLTRWHRDALYVVVVMRTPHGLPPTFETRLARLKRLRNGRFDLAVPVRKGWSTIVANDTLNNCLLNLQDCSCG